MAWWNFWRKRELFLHLRSIGRTPDGGYLIQWTCLLCNIGWEKITFRILQDIGDIGLRCLHCGQETTVKDLQEDNYRKRLAEFLTKQAEKEKTIETELLASKGKRIVEAGTKE